MRPGLLLGLLFTVFTAVPLCGWAGGLPGPRQTEQYERALKLYEARNYRAAMKAAKPLIVHFPGWAEASLLYARCARATATIEGRQVATQTLKRARLFSPDRPDLLRELASVYLEQGFEGEARVQYEALAGAAPGDSDAHWMLAALAERDWIRFGRPEDLLRLIAELEQAVQADSTNVTALRRLCAACLDNEDLPGMEAAVGRLLRVAPGDSAGLMLSAIALHRKAKYEEALVRWERFFLVSDSVTRAQFEDVDLLLVSSERSELGGLSGEARERFVRRLWKRLDPTPTTRLNERLLEHWYRVGVSNALFSDVEAGIPGCRTVPGQMLIRYGLPKRREHVFRIPGASWSGRPVLTWHYVDKSGPFTLAFVDPSLSGVYSYFSLDKRQSTLGDRRHYRPTTYDHDYGLETYDAFLGAAGFLRGSGVRGEFYVAVPLEKVSKGDWRRVPLELAVFDTLWNEVSLVKSTLDSARTFAGMGPDTLVVQELTLDLEPNRYVVAVSVRDTAVGTLGRAERVFDVVGFSKGSLGVSDIELAYILPERRTTRGLGKDSRVLPNPTARYFAPEPLKLYYEVYNLSMDRGGEFGFTVKYSIVPSQTRGSPSWESAAASSRPGRHYVVSSFERQVAGPSSSEQLTIDLSELAGGHYSLVMEVTDSVSRWTVATHATFEHVRANTGE